MLNDSVRKNAELEIDQKTKSHMQRHHVDYRTAYLKVREANPDLARRYAWGSDAVVEKRYTAETLTPAQREMALLVADAPRTRTLASWTEDHLARQPLKNVGPGVAMPADEYRRSLANVRKKYPTLARAAQDGFIAANDWNLLAMLIPSLAGEVERGNFSRTESTRCSCGENKAYCRGKKLARQRGVHEDSVKAFAQCILEAREHGNELDKIRCYY